MSEWDAGERETRFTLAAGPPDVVTLGFVGPGFRGTFAATLTAEGEQTRVDVEEQIALESAVAAVLSSFSFDLDAFVVRWLDDVAAEAARVAVTVAVSEASTSFRTCGSLVDDHGRREA